MRFVLLVKSDWDAEAECTPTAAMLDAMNGYNQDLVRAGVLLAAEGFHPASRGARIRFADGKVRIVDPSAEVAEQVAGFWLIQVKSRDEAIAWARRCPLAPEGSGVEVEIELRQVFELDPRS